MKKIIFLLLITFLNTHSISVNAWWYPSSPIATDFAVGWAWWTNWSCPWNINDNTCDWDSSAYETYCFNPVWWTSQTWDESPVWDDYSAVVWTVTSPYYSDISSDNDDHDGDFDYITDTSWTMYCYYWDAVKFERVNYELSPSNVLFDGSTYADWENKNLNINFRLKTFVGIGPTIDIVLDDLDHWLKSIKFTLKFYDNTLMDQSDLSSWTSVIVENIDWVVTDSIASNIRTIVYNIDSWSDLDNYSDLIDQFKLRFRIYNSTLWDYTDIDRNFILQSIEYDAVLQWWASYSGINIYDTNWNEMDWSHEIDILVGSLYDINVTWELAPTWVWFVEWRVQTGSLDITANIPTPLPASLTPDWIYLVQTWTLSSSFTSSWIIDNSGSSLPNKFISENLLLNDEFIEFDVFLANSNFILKTLFTLVDNATAYLIDLKDVRIYEYIKYSLDWHDIAYLAWILNQGNSQIFDPLKIYWIANISKDKQKDLTSNQDAENIHNLKWELIKASLKNDLRRAAINTVKFIYFNWVDWNWAVGNNHISIQDLTWSNWSTNNDWKILGDILYFWNLNWSSLNWQNVVLDNWNYDNISWNKVSWKKTIIIKWWNLYIKSNIINESNSDMLWIIVLKDSMWMGWNIYIDTSVQEIDAIIYADKSLISYNLNYENWDIDLEFITNHEIDWNVNNSLMENQLYIYWTVFSENVIWASRLNPPVCPFWVYSNNTISCNSIGAQRYDLFYLRSWFNNKYNSWYADFPIIIKYNSRLQQSPPPLFSK